MEIYFIELPIQNEKHLKAVFFDGSYIVRSVFIKINIVFPSGENGVDIKRQSQLMSSVNIFKTFRVRRNKVTRCEGYFDDRLKTEELLQNTILMIG